MEDLDWLLAFVIGNQEDDTLYLSDWNDLPDLTKKLFKKLDRTSLPLTVIVPRYSNKEDYHDMKIWCLARYQKGLAAQGWLQVGREFPTVINPPLEAFLPTLHAMRGACEPATRDRMLMCCMPAARYDMI